VASYKKVSLRKAERLNTYAERMLRFPVK
jgi:hypothetical protein